VQLKERRSEKARPLSLGIEKLEPDAEDSVAIGCRNDLEPTDLLRGMNMFAPARARVVVTNSDDPEVVSRFIRKAPEIEDLSGLPTRHRSFRHPHVRVNNLVYSSLNVAKFFVREIAIKVVIALGFLFLDVSTEGAALVKHPYHGLVQDVLGGVHAWIVLFRHCYGTSSSGFRVFSTIFLNALAVIPVTCLN